MRAKGLKEQQIGIIHIPTDIKLQSCRYPSLLLGKRLIESPAGLLVIYIVKRVA